MVRRFDRATKAFYKRCKEGRNPGFPRFKPRHRWRSVEIPDASASMAVPPDAENGKPIWLNLAVGIRKPDAYVSPTQPFRPLQSRPIESSLPTLA